MRRSILSSLLFAGLVQVRAQHDASVFEDEDSFFQFVTRPDIGAPKWDIKMYDRDALEPGRYWFIGPYAALNQLDFPLWNGPHIYDGDGELIWSGAPLVKYVNTFDFRMSEVDGQQMLSFIWPGPHKGNGYILDNSYQVYRQVDMVGNKTKWNMHEFNLLDDGKTALMAFPQDYHPTRVNVPAYNGTCRIGWQGFKEVEVDTGEVVFEWAAQGHVSVEESTYTAKNVEDSWQSRCAHDWDITHINAVDRFDDGDYLFSARHTDTIYKVSHVDGSIVWRLGGSRSDFEMIDTRAKFTRQHHARFRGQNATHTLISLFDNAVGSGDMEDYSSSASWGLHLVLRTDVKPMTVGLVARFEKPLVENEHDYSKSRGSVSFMPNGNAFVGWVTGSHISEHAPDGRLLMSAMLKQAKAQSYRSYKMPWVGRPAQPPDVVALSTERRPGSKELTTTVHVSWNGATDVATWNVLHTNAWGNISDLAASSPRQGFETTLTVDGFAKHVVVVALDGNGEELGRSKIVTVNLPPDLQSLSVAHGETAWVHNHSSSWWEAPVNPGPSMWGRFQFFILGFVFCVVLSCVGIAYGLRRRSRQRGMLWWRSPQSAYQSVSGSDEDVTEQRAWMLDEKDDGIEEYEEEASDGKPEP